MVLSAPVLRPKSHRSFNTTVRQGTNLGDYLHHVNELLVQQNFNFANDYSTAIAQLKHTLIRLEVAQIKRTAIAQGIWDFYPTPGAVIDKMLALAELKSHHHVLEPSAGTGDLANAIALARVNKIDCFELHPLLQKALNLQGFNVIGADFFASTPQPIYDRIIANPPFSNNGVARHTIHAFQFLKPGGKLISLAHHYQLQPSHSDQQFFAWLKKHNARFLNCGQAFRNSPRSTNVNLQIILIDKLENG